MMSSIFLYYLELPSILDFLSSVLRIRNRVCLLFEMKNRMPHFSKIPFFDIIVCSYTVKFLKFFPKSVKFVVDNIHTVFL